MKAKHHVSFAVAVLIIILGLINCEAPDKSDSLKALKNMQITEKQNKLLQDSLEQSRKQFLKEKEEMAAKLEQYQTDLIRSDSFQKQHLLLEESELQRVLAKMTTEQNTLNYKLENIKKKQSELQKEEDFTNTAKKRAKLYVSDEINYIDSIMDSLERMQSIEQRRLPLLQKKLDIVMLKIKALNEEHALFVEEKNNLIRNNANDEQFDSVNKKITALNAEIADEQKNRVKAESELIESRNLIEKINGQLKDLNSRIEQKQSKKAALDEYLESEIIRLQNERQRISERKELLMSEMADLNEQMDSLQKRLTKVNDNLEQTVNVLSQTNTELNRLDEESKLDNSQTKSESENNIKKMSPDTIKKDNQFESELPDVQQNNEVVSNSWTNIIITIFLISVILIVFLYFVGKINRKKNKNI